MKTTTQCGVCSAKIDIEEGLMIGGCMSRLGKKNVYYNHAHNIVVDPATAQGAAILAHIEKKPSTKAS